MFFILCAPLNGKNKKKKISTKNIKCKLDFDYGFKYIAFICCREKKIFVIIFLVKNVQKKNFFYQDFGRIWLKIFY